MKNFPSPITAENFNEAKLFVSKALAKSKRKTLIRKIVEPLCAILFFVIAALLVFGAILSLSDAKEMIVFEKLSFITTIWEKYSGLLTTPDMVWYLYWGILVASLFVIPILASLIVTIIVSIAYKPSVSIEEDGTEAQKAKFLHQAASKISAKSSGEDTFGVILSVIFIVLFAAFLIYAFFVLETEFSVGLIVGLIVGMGLVGVVLYFVYSIAYVFVSTTVSNFYYVKSVGSITDETEKYWLSVDPEEVTRRKEEEERRQKEAAEARAKAAANRELGAQKRIQGLEEEHAGRYSAAKRLFREAAYLGDALGMDNYARHCLIDGKRDDAIYWLQQSINTGEADSQSRELLRALKNGEHINAHYN